ncbi:MAG: rhodanese-like domain-containing protein [Cyclobacteriaceae bacterium]
MKWVWIALISFACGSSSNNQQQVSLIDNTQLSELLKNSEVQLVDVRTPEEVNHGIIERAIVIDIYDPEFDAKVNQLAKDKPVAIYCAAGGRSAKASEKFAMLGFRTIYDLEGGFRGWQSAGNPVVMP